MWLFIVLPLTVLGGLLGKKHGLDCPTSCRVTPIPRPIPNGPWYLDPLVLIPVSGALPFGSIFIEIFFIFSSFWQFKVYYVYGFMLLMSLMLAIVVSCICIVIVYFLLNSEDYRWHWTIFYVGGSTSLYIYIYSIYYFYMKTK